MKKIVIRSFIMLLLLMTFFVIFGFSSQEGEKSSSISKKVSRIIVDVFPVTKGKSEKAKQNIVEAIHPFVRKLAHFSVYMVVGILMMSFMNTYEISLRKQILISLIVGFIYACSDEIHQSFTPDRTPAITDVIIDTAGVSIGILIILAIISIIRTLKQDRKQIILKKGDVIL